MNTWKIRHEGSPRSIDNLTYPQVLEGLADGYWEATDEVMGPNDKTWVAIENHPQLAEPASELQPREPKTYDDETRLDMTPLIDVTLVLLIFFILTTSYAMLQKRLDAPNASNKDLKEAVVTKDQIDDQMIKVEIALENNAPVYRIENKVVSQDALITELSQAVQSAKRTEIGLMHDPEVNHGAVTAVINAASLAGVDRVTLITK